MELKGRLRLIADKVPNCDTVCDIGTDHAYIPIYLVQKKVCKKAIAVDVKKGPIKAATENIKHYKLYASIETRLGDGLDPISVGEADTIIIAGMGGSLIAEILEKGFKQAKEAKHLILQPMNDMDITRVWLFENGFEIYDEGLAEEGTKIYNVICARWKGEKTIVTKNIYFYVGEKLIEKNDPLLSKLLIKRSTQLNKALSELKYADESQNDVIVKYKTILNEIEELEKGLIGGDR